MVRHDEDKGGESLEGDATTPYVLKLSSTAQTPLILRYRSNRVEISIIASTTRRNR